MLLAQKEHTIPTEQGMLNSLAYTVAVRYNVVLCTPQSYHHLDR